MLDFLFHKVSAAENRNKFFVFRKQESQIIILTFSFQTLPRITKI